MIIKNLTFYKNVKKLSFILLEDFFIEKFMLLCIKIMLVKTFLAVENYSGQNCHKKLTNFVFSILLTFYHFPIEGITTTSDIFFLYIKNNFLQKQHFPKLLILKLKAYFEHILLQSGFKP